MVLIVKTNLGAAGDVGVYNSSGTLVLNGGSGSLGATAALYSISPVQTGSARILSPGQYYVAITWPTGGTGKLEGASTVTAGAVFRTGTISGAGGSVLPASITLSSIVAGVDLYEVTLHN
jgi:hypothetical protein